MIASEMIRKMAKAYTDYQIYTQSQKLTSGTGWWGNGFMAFFEDVPEGLADLDDVVSDGDDLKLWEWVQATGPQVWPVMLKSIGDASHWIEVMFTDGQDVKIWANARYVSAILKRDPHVDWHYTNACDGQLKASNGKVIALLMPIAKDDVDRVALEYSEWSISNFDLVAPRYLKIAHQVDALLPRGKKGQVWQDVQVNGQTVQAMRKTTPGLTWTEGIAKKHDAGLGNGTMTKNFCPCRNTERRHTKKKIEICIRQNGRQAEIDLYDGYTRLGMSNE